MPIDYENHQPKGSDFPDRPNIQFQNIGDGVSGTVLEARQVKTRRGDIVLLYVVDDGEGTEWNLWASTIDLEQQLMDKRVQEGDTISVRFAEVRPLENGSSMKLFDVTVDSVQAVSAAPTAGKPNEEAF